MACLAMVTADTRGTFGMNGKGAREWVYRWEDGCIYLLVGEINSETRRQSHVAQGEERRCLVIGAGDASG
jgi:hypothetical protein